MCWYYVFVIFIEMRRVGNRRREEVKVELLKVSYGKDWFKRRKED